jgi:hypothetical protein
MPGLLAERASPMPALGASGSSSSETSVSVGAERSSSISPVAWIPTKEMDFAEWATAGRRLAAMGRCGQWGIGDWIRYGNTKFGERYAWAARVTGYDTQTLMNMVYVASRFEISRRRENLSWSHHETLAALEPGEQNAWLDRVEGDRLSVSDLRRELRSVRRGARGSTAAAGSGAAAASLPGEAPAGAPPGLSLDRPAGAVAHTGPGALARPTSVSGNALTCPHCGGQVSLVDLDLAS